MVKEVIIVEVKRRLIKWLYGLLPAIIGFLLIVLIAASLVSQLGKIEINNNEAMVNEAYSGLIHPTKLISYKAYEDLSYPSNRKVMAKIYTKSLEGQRPDQEKTTYSLDINWDKPDIVKVEADFLLGDQTYAYRLYWQLLAACDVIAQESDASRLEAVTKALSPVFTYSFDLEEEDFDYHNTEYTDTKTEVKTYINGQYDSKKTSLRTTVKKTPLPYLKKVSTMFADYTFTYQEVVIAESDFKVIDEREHTSITYQEDENGVYKKTDNGYELIDFTKSDLPEIRYKKIITKEVVTSSQASLTTGYNMDLSSEANYRYLDMMSSGHIRGLNEKDTDILLEIAVFLPNAYELASQIAAYTPFKVTRPSIDGYKGSIKGPESYILSDQETDFEFPILFDDSVKEKLVKVTSPFGPDILTINGSTINRDHTGIDFALAIGTPIVASKKGQVVTAKYGAKAGYHIVIKHEDDLYSVYLHLNTLLAKDGDMVETNDLIATSGNSGYSTGPHLHFAIRSSDFIYYDPLKYLALERGN